MHQNEINTNYYINNSVYYKCSDNCIKCYNYTYCQNCENNYALVDFEKNGTIMCLPIKEIFNGYYKGNNSVYYKCIDNCKNCSNSQSCNQCHYNNYLVGNRENGNLICLPETELNIGYYKENNSIYYKCIDNCNKCKNINSCIECQEKYTFVGNQENNDLICIFQEELNVGYYQDNNSIFYKCLDYCNNCTNSINCFECLENYSLVANLENDDLICMFQDDLSIGYYKDENSIYHKCLENCDICINSSSCVQCQDNYTLVGNKINNDLICLFGEEIKKGYYQDNNSIFYPCMNYCEICTNDSNCNKCFDNFDYDSDMDLYSGRIENCEIYYLNGSCLKCE